MKRGLKEWTGSARRLAAARVEETSPMKRGLKVATAVSGHGAAASG